MTATDNLLKSLTGLEKLQAGINAARNNESMSKGNTTNYYAATKLSQETIDEYIKLELDKNKKPNIKSLITFGKNEFIRRGYKLELFPTVEQTELLIKFVDAYRWTYNHYVAERKTLYRNHFNNCFRKKSFNWFFKNDKKQLNKIPTYNPLYLKKEFLPEWMQCVPSVLINGCIRSFPKKPSGFRKKGNSLNEFCIHQGDTIKIVQDEIQIPLIGKIKHSRINYIPNDIKICILGISFKNNRWYAGLSCSLNKKKPELKTTGNVVGIDVGVRKSAVTWNGKNHSEYFLSEVLENELLSLEKSKKRWQRTTSRRAKKDSLGRLLPEQSKRYLFAKNQVGLIYERINNILNDNTNQISHRITRKDNKEIIIEDLNVSGMLAKNKDKNAKISRRSLHRSIARASMSKLLNKIIYKASWRGIKITKASRWFASSKICSACQQKNSNLNSEEVWTCPNCNVKHNRDENASKNLQRYNDPCWNGYYKYLETVKVNKRSAGPSSSMGQAIKDKKLSKIKPKRMNKGSNTII